MCTQCGRLCLFSAGTTSALIIMSGKSGECVCVRKEKEIEIEKRETKSERLTTLCYDTWMLLFLPAG